MLFHAINLHLNSLIQTCMLHSLVIYPLDVISHLFSSHFLILERNPTLKFRFSLNDFGQLKTRQLFCVGVLDEYQKNRVSNERVTQNRAIIRDKFTKALTTRGQSWATHKLRKLNHTQDTLLLKCGVQMHMHIACLHAEIQ